MATGAKISGWLINKTERKIEIQTEHGVLEIRKNDLNPESWQKAQRTLPSKPKIIKEKEFSPKPRNTKEIRVSATQDEDKPTPVPYQGTFKHSNQPKDYLSTTTQQPTAQQSEGTEHRDPNKGTANDTNPGISADTQTTDAEDIIEEVKTIQMPNIPKISKEVLEESKKDARRVFFPLTIVALCLVLLAKSQTPLKTKISGYIILGLLMLSIITENTLFGIISISFLCILMLTLEALNARKKAIEEALNLPRSQKPTYKEEPKAPDTSNIKQLKITPYQLARLEWKKFEEFCCLWLTHQGMEVTKTFPNNNHSLQKVIEGYCKDMKSDDKVHFKAIYKNWDRPVSIKEVKEIRKLCTSTEIPILISVGGFDKEAIAWAKDDKVRLIGNKEIIETFKNFSEENKLKIINEIWDGTQEVPTCPVCNIKMTVWQKQDPDQAKNQFWHCNNFSTCHQRIVMRSPHIIKEDKIYPNFAQPQ
jgi:diacylglycerol kinase